MLDFNGIHRRVLTPLSPSKWCAALRKPEDLSCWPSWITFFHCTNSINRLILGHWLYSEVVHLNISAIRRHDHLFKSPPLTVFFGIKFTAPTWWQAYTFKLCLYLLQHHIHINTSSWMWSLQISSEWSVKLHQTQFQPFSEIHKGTENHQLLV